MIQLNKKLIRLIDKQFEMIKVDIRFSDIPKDGLVAVGKKKDYWYNVYKFSEEQEVEWEKWCMEELKNVYKNPYKIFAELNILYGFIRKYK